MFRASFGSRQRGLTDKLLSQSYGAERALGHSSRFLESGFPLKGRAAGCRGVEQQQPGKIRQARNLKAAILPLRHDARLHRDANGERASTSAI